MIMVPANVVATQSMSASRAAEKSLLVYRASVIIAAPRSPLGGDARRSGGVDVPRPPSQDDRRGTLVFGVLKLFAGDGFAGGPVVLSAAGAGEGDREAPGASACAAHSLKKSPGPPASMAPSPGPLCWSEPW